MYQFGDGIGQSYLKAIELYKMATENNSRIGMKNLIDVFKDAGEEYKNDAIKYFVAINEANTLKEIYDYDDFVIEALQKNLILKSENEILQKKVTAYEAHIDNSPDGKYYFENLKLWNEKYKN
jgi:hypothetical protein